MKFLLDHNLTPKGAELGWTFIPPIDIAHAHHRAREAISDSKLWAYAQTEQRAVVTINAKDFVPLAARSNSAHCGLFLMPSGFPRMGQLACLERICRFAVAEDRENRSAHDRVFCADASGVQEFDVSDYDGIDNFLSKHL